MGAKRQYYKFDFKNKTEVRSNISHPLAFDNPLIVNFLFSIFRIQKRISIFRIQKTSMRCCKYMSMVQETVWKKNTKKCWEKYDHISVHYSITVHYKNINYSITVYYRNIYDYITVHYSLRNIRLLVTHKIQCHSSLSQLAWKLLCFLSYKSTWLGSIN